VSLAVGAQTIDLAQPIPFEGYDEWYLEREGLINEGGSINFPWLIQLSAMIGNASTVGQFFNPHWYDSEVGMDATGFGSGNYSGKGGNSAVGGTVIWW
jgi:hypothetical protein